MKKVAVHLSNYSLREPYLRHTEISDIEVFHNIDDFLASNIPYKIALIEPDYEHPDDLKSMLFKLSDIDKIVLHTIELLEYMVDIIKTFDKPNFEFIIPGRLNFEPKYATVNHNNHWISQTSGYYFNNERNLIQEKHKSFIEKQYYFEVMYGLENIFKKNLKEKLNEFDPDLIYQTTFLTEASVLPIITQTHNNIWEDDLWFDGKTTRYRSWNCSIYPSQVIPFKIYEKAAYSLVIESSRNSEFSFFTEKIAKPILASRLFIVFAGQYYLRNLREFGFKTFNGIIDESYDSEPDDTKRWDQALHEVRKLCQLDQRTVLNTCAEIFIHNYNIIQQYSSAEYLRSPEDILDEFAVQRNSNIQLL